MCKEEEPIQVRPAALGRRMASPHPHLCQGIEMGSILITAVEGRLGEFQLMITARRSAAEEKGREE